MSAPEKRRRRASLAVLTPGRLLLGGLGLAISGLVVLQIADRGRNTVDTEVTSHQINQDLKSGLAAVGVNSSAAPVEAGTEFDSDLAGQLRIPSIGDDATQADLAAIETGSIGPEDSANAGPLFESSVGLSTGLAPQASPIPVTVDSADEPVQQAIITTGGRPTPTQPVWFTGSIEPIDD